MKEDPEIRMIPVKDIRVINPRFRDKKKFDQIIQNVASLGLKKPITVSFRSKSEDENKGFDLVCGQGRLEAHIALGWKEIPCIVINVCKEDRLLMSLVENLARRNSTALELIHEIKRLKEQGCNNVEIGRRVGLSNPLVGGLLALANAGEERLFDAAVRGRISISVAIQIAKSNDPETQKELLNAYEAKQVNFPMLSRIRRLMEQRRFLGKSTLNDSKTRKKPRISAEGLILAYRRETQRQKLMIKKARVCESRLMFTVGAFKKLMADGDFINLLKAENLDNAPKIIEERVYATST